MGHVTHRPRPADGWIGRCRAPCPAHHLQRAGREVLVLDRAARVGDRWRGHWDSLRLYSPAWADGLPGRPYPGPTWHFPSKDEFADYLEQYADELALPVRLGTRVLRVAPSAGSGYAVTTDAGHLTADNVVIATGTFGTTPKVPDFADRIDPSIVQLHSSEYRGPDQLSDGPTILVGRDTGQIPVPFSSPRLRVVMPLMFFAMQHVLTRRTPMGRKAMPTVPTRARVRA